jgi:hypothetical protein
VQVGHGIDRRHEAFDGVGENHAGTQQFDVGLELGEILGQQGIARRYRADRHAGMQAGEHQQGVLDAVVGQHQHRPLGRKLLPEQPGGDAIDAGQGVAIRHFHPLAVRAPFGDQDGIRRFGRPAFQPLAGTAGKARQFELGAEQPGTVRPGFEDDGRIDEQLGRLAGNRVHVTSFRDKRAQRAEQAWAGKYVCGVPVCVSFAAITSR